MALDEVVRLIKYGEPGVDEDGNEVPVKIYTDVFATRQSIGQKEFYEAGQTKLNPAFVLLVFLYDYDGEREVEVDGDVYRIYRTYVPDVVRKNARFPTREYIELYCEERVTDG